MRKAIVPLAGLACLALTPAAQAAPPPGAPACSVFPANNIWNADVSTLPVNPSSALWLASAGTPRGAGYSSRAQVVITTMQHYGLILADNGSNWYFQGTQGERWDDGLLDAPQRIPAGQFEAVDESSLMISPDSAVVRPAAG